MRYERNPPACNLTSKISMKVICILASLLCFSSVNGQTVERGDVIKTAKLDAVILPEESFPLKLAPQEWTDFIIEECLAHGTRVEEGQVLIKAKKDKYDQKITDLTQQISLDTLSLELLQKELEDMEALTPLQIQEVEERQKRKEVDHLHFMEKEYPRLLENYTKTLEGSEWEYKNAQEELEQLQAMYEEDDLTEETEEIILQRAKYSAELSKWRYERAKEDHQKITEISLPRRLEDRKLSFTESTFENEEKKRSIPRLLEQKRIEVKQKEIALECNKESLEKLERDSSFFELKSPADGTFYYGMIENGLWQGATTTEKFMRTGGKLVLEKNFACLIPDDAKMQAFAQVEPDVVGILKKGQKGILTMNYDRGQRYPIECSMIGEAPLANGKFLALFKLEGAIDLPITYTGECNLLIAEEKDVLRVPEKALTTLPNGNVIARVLAPKENNELPATAEEGDDQKELEEPSSEQKQKAKKRLVQTGLFGDDYVEILEDLKEGELLERFKK